MHKPAMFLFLISFSLSGHCQDLGGYARNSMGMRFEGPSLGLMYNAASSFEFEDVRDNLGRNSNFIYHSQPAVGLAIGYDSAPIGSTIFSASFAYEFERRIRSLSRSHASEIFFEAEPTASLMSLNANLGYRFYTLALVLGGNYLSVNYKKAADSGDTSIFKGDFGYQAGFTIYTDLNLILDFFYKEQRLILENGSQDTKGKIAGVLFQTRYLF